MKSPKPLTPIEQAIRTAKWATTMTKWRIAFETNGKIIGKKQVKRARRWQLVAFPGPHGRESRGVVDLLAIRRNQKDLPGPLNRGDLFEIVLIQVKGGSAPYPSYDDLVRLQAVSDSYNAKAILLAKWIKAKDLCFYQLKEPWGWDGSRETPWEDADLGKVFA